MTRIVIAGGGTGGHLMPALALADALRALDAAVTPVLVGAARGVEGRILPERRFPYHLIPAEPIYRRAWWRNLRWPLVAWRVFRACRRILDEEQPALVLGTGGYAAGPILALAVRRRIPIALQEQNAYPGLTTRWLASRAHQIHLGFPEAAAHLRAGARTEVLSFGNPIVPPPEPRPDRREARRRLDLPPDRPVVLVTGGSQGAQRINQAVAAAVDRGAFEGVSLLWSTGPGMLDQYGRYDAPPARCVRAFWDPIAEAYAASALVIARAGAMTTAELCAWGLPSILIPLKAAAADHQSRNARALATAGAAVHLPERALGADALDTTLRRLLEAPAELAEMQRAARMRGRPDAARASARRLLALVS